MSTVIASRAGLNALREQYRAFVAAFREAAALWRRGVFSASFPLFSFPPRVVPLGVAQISGAVMRPEWRRPWTFSLASPGRTSYLVEKVVTRMLTVPLARATTRPVESTPASSISLLLHLRESTSAGRPSGSVAFAEHWVLFMTSKVVAAQVTVIRTCGFSLRSSLLSSSQIGRFSSRD